MRSTTQKAMTISVKLVAFLLFVFLVTSSQASAKLWGDKGYPIYPVKFGRAGQNNPITIQSGKNEHHFLIFEVSEVTPDNLIIDLVARDSAPIPELETWQLLPVPTNLPDRFFDDGLVPLNSQLTIPQNPFYVAISLKIPATQPNGKSTYELIFRNGSQWVSQPLNLRVWRFCLSDDLPITNMGVFWPNKSWLSGYASDGYEAIFDAYLKAMRQYKFNAVNVFPLPADEVAAGSPITQYPNFLSRLNLVMEKLKYRYFRLPKLDGAKSVGLPGNQFQENAEKYYSALLDYLKQEGWASKALVKLWDEPNPEDYATVALTYRIVKTIAPEFRMECSGGIPSLDLANAIDAWALYGLNYDFEQLAPLRAGGKELWLYANKLHGPSRPPVCQRSIGLYVFAYDFSGYLLWGVNYWPQDVWSNPPGDADSSRRGAFYYPDPRSGMPLPTLRLEALRRGWEDYQYLSLLAQSVAQGVVSQKTLTKTRNKLASLIGDIKKLSPPANWNDLEKFRLELGALLDQISAGG